MVDDPEVIRRQMEETRSQLADKLEALETQVADTVESASAGVSETVDAVKETVENVTETIQETVHSITNVFDLSLQTERHPWIVFGGSVALGCLAASWLTRRAGVVAQEVPTVPSRTSALPPEPRDENRHRRDEPAEPAKAEQGWFREELTRIKGLAVGALMGVVRDLAARGFSGALGERIAEEVDHLTPKLGGERIAGPLIPPRTEGEPGPGI